MQLTTAFLHRVLDVVFDNNKTAMALKFDLNRRVLQRMFSGETPIPATLDGDVAQAIADEIARANSIIARLKTRAPSDDTARRVASAESRLSKLHKLTNTLGLAEGSQDRDV